MKLAHLSVHAVRIFQGIHFAATALTGKKTDNYVERLPPTSTMFKWPDLGKKLDKLTIGEEYIEDNEKLSPDQKAAIMRVAERAKRASMAYSTISDVIEEEPSYQRYTSNCRSSHPL